MRYARFTNIDDGTTICINPAQVCHTRPAGKDTTQIHFESRYVTVKGEIESVTSFLESALN